MSIIKGYTTSDGKSFATMAEAKAHEAEKRAAEFLSRADALGGTTAEATVALIRRDPEAARKALGPLMPVKRPRVAKAGK